jgi:hypothetical protein
MGKGKSKNKYKANPRHKYLSEMTDAEIIRSAEWLYWCTDDKPFALRVMTYLAERVTAAHWPEKERPPDGEELEEKFAEGAEKADAPDEGNYARGIVDTDSVAVRGDN